jgi:hypothetical protein
MQIHSNTSTQTTLLIGCKEAAAWRDWRQTQQTAVSKFPKQLRHLDWIAL